jgi:hypothetical protein
MDTRQVWAYLRGVDQDLRADLAALRTVFEDQPAMQLRDALQEIHEDEDLSHLPLDSALLADFAILKTEEFLVQRRLAAFSERAMSRDRRELYEDQLRTAVTSMHAHLIEPRGEILEFPSTLRRS